MDATRFDGLVRALAGKPSRRRVAGALSGLTLAGAISPLLDQPTGVAGKKKKKVPLCHEGQTISVSKKAKKKHLKHGDTLGACPTPPPPPPPGSTTTTTTTLPPGSCAGGEGSDCGSAGSLCNCAADPSNLDQLRCVSLDSFDPEDTCLSDDECTDGKICAVEFTNSDEAFCLLPCSV